MLRWNSVSDIPAGYGPSVVTLGNFDGVHRGHRAVLTTAVAQAATRGCPAVAVTFDPHPIAVLRPDDAPERITSATQRDELIAATGLDGLLVMKFTKELALWSPATFVHDVFVRALAARAVVVGEDTRFGYRNSGDISTLRELGTAYGFEVITVGEIGEGTRWSSTQIRLMLAEGAVAAAAGLLGRPHQVVGTVVHGAHRGRELGFPTANLAHDSAGMVPADGVYAGWLVRLDLPVHAPDRTMPAAVSVGTNPTFDGHQRTVEAYVLDRTDLDLYDERVAVEFVEHLRPMLRYDTIHDLLEQMRIDVSDCRRILSSIVPG